MPQFVQGFLDRALPKEALLCGKPIKLLMKSAERDDGNRTVELRLAKQKAKHRNGKVHIGHSEHPGSISRSGLGEPFVIFYD